MGIFLVKDHNTRTVDFAFNHSSAIEKLYEHRVHNNSDFIYIDEWRIRDVGYGIILVVTVLVLAFAIFK